MKIALIQQRAGEDRAENLERALEAMGRAADMGARVAGFAELAIDTFFPRHGGDPEAERRAEPIPGPSCDAVAARAKELGLVTVFNIYERDAEGRCFDSSPVFDADGSLLGITRMVHVADLPGFREKDYYAPGDRGAPVYETQAGRIGVAICYDRHFPEYTRALGVRGAELVLIPQAGLTGEWDDGLQEAEVRTAAFQNGYFAALINRVGVERGGMSDEQDFAGESFACDPWGRVLARGASREDDVVIAEVELGDCPQSPARRYFWQDRRPELYGDWLG